MTIAPRKSLFFNASLNLLGQGSNALAAVVCVPIYIQLLGMDGFGLIGFHLTLQTILKIVDLGLTPTVIREMARASSTAEGRFELVDTARTFELLFLAMAATITTLLALVSPWIADHWIKRGTLSIEAVGVSVFLMSFLNGIQWMSGFYQSALSGLERQATLNGIRVVETLSSAFGAVALLFSMGPRVELVFYWQTLVAALALIAYAIGVRVALPSALDRGRFRPSHLRRVVRFAWGMTIITTAGLVLSNMDRVLVSKLYSLDAFGTYALSAFAIGTLVSVMILPFFNVMLPRFTSLATMGEPRKLEDLYHLAVQMVASICFALVFTIDFFAADLIVFWTGKPEVGDAVARLMLILGVGMTFNCLTLPAYLMQLSHGWTSLGSRLGLGLLAVFGPTLLLATHLHGATGAATNYAAMNAVYWLLCVPLTLARLLPGRAFGSLIRDILPPLGLTLAFAGVVALVPFADWPLTARVGFGLGCGATALFGSALLCGRTRGELLARVGFAARMLGFTRSGE